jgi:hypothetical protein
MREINDFNRIINEKNKTQNAKAENKNDNNINNINNINDKLINEKSDDNSKSLNTCMTEIVFIDKEKVKIINDDEKYYDFSICEKNSLLINQNQPQSQFKNVDRNNKNNNKDNINTHIDNNNNNINLKEDIKNLLRKNSSTTSFLENSNNPFRKNIDTIEIESFIDENTKKNIKYENNNINININSNRSSSSFLSKMDYDQISVKTINTISIKDDYEDDDLFIDN